MKNEVSAVEIYGVLLAAIALLLVLGLVMGSVRMPAHKPLSRRLPVLMIELRHCDCRYHSEVDR